MSESVYRVECVFFFFFKRESFFCVELERVLKRERERSEFHPPKESVVCAREKEFDKSGELKKRARERRTYIEAKRSLLARSSTHIK